MDQILVGRILDTDLESYRLQFSEVITFIDKVSNNKIIRDWLQVANNFIGFCVGIRYSFQFVFNQSIEKVQSALENFDKAFKSINPSKVNVGKFRRELSKHFIEKADELFSKDSDFLTERFFELTVSE